MVMAAEKAWRHAEVRCMLERLVVCAQVVVLARGILCKELQHHDSRNDVALHRAGEAHDPLVQALDLRVFVRKLHARACSLRNVANVLAAAANNKPGCCRRDDEAHRLVPPCFRPAYVGIYLL
jgi:hypothetical protein